jgi:hypothetical protein
LCATLLTHFPSAGKCGVKLAEQRSCEIGHQVPSKCEGGAAQAAKMRCCEYARTLTDCSAGGGGAAAGIYWIGAGRGKRAVDSGSGADAVFAGTEACGTDHAGSTRIAGRDIWMVFAGGDCGECRVLLCDFRSARVFGYPPTRGTIEAKPSLRSLGRAEAQPLQHHYNAWITPTPLAAFDLGCWEKSLFRLLGRGGTACRGAWLRRVR